MNTLKFTEHCKANNIELLKDDKKFLLAHISPIKDSDLRKTLLSNYCRDWCKGMDEEPICALKQNKGRKRANLGLLQSLNLK